MTPASVRFHTFVFSNVLVCLPQVEREMNYSKYAKLKEYTKLF